MVPTARAAEIAALRCAQACAVALLCGAVAPPVRAAEFSVEGEAGVGYDANLDAASSWDEAEGSLYGSGAAGLAVASGPGRLRVQAATHWSVVEYSEVDDLSVHRWAGSAAAFARVFPGGIASARASLGGSFYGDGDRDSFDLGLALGLRWQLRDRLALRPGYAFLREDARVAAFDRIRHTFSLGLEAEPWRGAWAALALSVDRDEVVRYLEIEEPTGPAALASGMPGSGGSSRGGAGHRVGTFGRPQQAERSDATAYGVALELEQAITEWLFVRSGVAYRRVVADPEPYHGLSAGVSAGLRWP